MTPTRRCRPLLGTYVEIAATIDKPETIERAFASISRIQNLMSFHSADSDVARMRTAPWGAPIAVAPETFEVLTVAQSLWRATTGLFDVTVGSKLVRDGFLPNPHPHYRQHYDGTAADIELCSDGTVICHRPMLIDLGGIAKGYAVDCACDALVTGGACGILVNAGGDLRVAAGPPQNFEIRGQHGRSIKTIRLQDMALASSENGRARKRHWTGRWRTPHRGRNMRAVVSKSVTSVTASRCIAADALTKVAMADLALAQRLAQAEGGFVVNTSPGA